MSDDPGVDLALETESSTSTTHRQLLRSPLGIGGIAFAVVVLLGLVTKSVGLGLAVVAVVALGIVGVVILRWQRAGTFGRLGLTALAGVAALVLGMALGIRTYDERFIYDNRTALWETLSLIGFFLTLGGALVLVGSLLGALVVAVIRLFR